jgi:hypothetical protein
MQSTITSTTPAHSNHHNRISCLTVGPNQIFVGTVGGDIQVIDKNTGAFIDKKWKQENTPIEGLMFDFEGKLVYGTEFNLCIVDKDFKQSVKNIRASQPLRKYLDVF